MDKLGARQKQKLKGIAHSLKPIIQVGKEGASETALQAILAAFGNREILKIKVLDAAPDDARQTAEKIEAQLEGVQVVQVIGKTIVLYRRHPENPEIEL